MSSRPRSRQPLHSNSSNSSHRSTLMRNHNLLIIAYFVILSLLMPPALALHMGMMGILTAMAIAALLLFLTIVVGKAIARKLKAIRLSRHQWGEILLGLPPTD